MLLAAAQSTAEYYKEIIVNAEARKSRPSPTRAGVDMPLATMRIVVTSVPFQREPFLERANTPIQLGVRDLDDGLR